VKVPSELLSFIRGERKFFISTHINPEGDALGSSLALAIALESLGKETILYRDGIPKFYNFLPGIERFTHSKPSLATSHWSLILLDCNTLERAGIEELCFKCSAVIDHHETEKAFGDIKWADPNAAATGVLIFYLIKELGIKITKDIAINLYAAIAIDTGTFRYGNTTSEVLRIASELIEMGANPLSISTSLYETWSRERFALLISALDTFEIINDIAIIVVTQDMYKKTKAFPEDTESFPNVPKVIKDIKVSALFRELDKNYWKVSLRSRTDINVATIALRFDGGGHKNAAGYTIKAELESAKESLLKELSIPSSI